MYKIEIYNKRLVILKEKDIKSKSVKPNNVFQERCSGQQTKISYCRQIRKNEKKLHSLLLDDNKCLYITLTTSDICSEQKLNKRFRSFYRSMKRLANDVEYVKVIDCHEDDRNFHLHIIFQFENGIPKFKGRTIGKNWIYKHWKYSSPKAIDVQYTYNAWGCLDYILNPKLKNALDSEDGFVKFKKYTRIVTCSKNLRYEEPIECLTATTFEEIYIVIKNFTNQFKQKYGYIPFKRSFYSN